MATIFNADYKKALIISNADYFLEGHCQLPGAKKDAEAMTQLLTSCGFDVTSVDDCDKEEYTKSIQAYLDAAKTLAKQNKKCLFFIYYSGHGALKDGMVYGLPCQGEGADQWLPLDENTRKLAIYANSYAIGFFDCAKVKDPTNVISQGATPAADEKIPGNCLLLETLFPGSKPVADVENASPATASFIEHMSKQQTMEIPKCLMTWKAKAQRLVKIIDKTHVPVSLK